MNLDVLPPPCLALALPLLREGRAQLRFIRGADHLGAELPEPMPAIMEGIGGAVVCGVACGVACGAWRVVRCVVCVVCGVVCGVWFVACGVRSTGHFRGNNFAKMSS